MAVKTQGGAVIARLYRIIPLVIVLAIIAFAVYFVVSYRSSPNRAKEVLIKSFTWLTKRPAFGVRPVDAARVRADWSVRPAWHEDPYGNTDMMRLLMVRRAPSTVSRNRSISSGVL